MSCGSVGNIKIEPVNVKWQIEEQWKVNTVADVASSLQNKYFRIRNGSDAKFHVWINVGGSGVDPAPSGSTGIAVAISANATAAAVATAVAAAVDAHADFHAVVDADDPTAVIITADDAGDSTDWDDFNTEFTLSQCQDGGNFDLGLLDGNVEAAFEEKLLELMAHQTGATPIADLRQGIGVEISLTLKECDAAHLKAIFARGAGGSDTPSGGTEVFGWGKDKLGQPTIIQARRLILHPVALANNVYTRDICFWKAYPLPDTLVFSGEDPQTLGVTFKCYLDDDKPAAIQMFGYGDWTQYVPVAP